MVSTSKLPQIFYTNLGLLFYAIAAIDNMVREEEVLSIKNNIQAKWKELDNYKEGEEPLDAIALTMTAAELAYKKHLDPEACFSRFVTFKKANEDLFTIERNKVIWNIANLIANSFSGVNKAELILIHKLKKVLQHS